MDVVRRKTKSYNSFYCKWSEDKVEQSHLYTIVYIYAICFTIEIWPWSGISQSADH